MAAVDRWADTLLEDNDFPGWHYRTSLMAHMAGQLMVRTVELAEDDSGAVTLSRAAEPTFLALPFEAAVEFFESKEPISIDAFRALQDRFRAGGFAAQAFTTDAIRRRAQSTILRSLEGQTTLAGVVEDLRNDQLSLGFTPSSYAYLETVSRNAVSSAYGHGKWEALHDPEVQSGRPFWQYLAIEDARSRPNHLALHERVFRTGTDESAYHFPPGGHRCRCTGRSLSQRQVERFGFTVTEGRVPGVDPDVGWEDPPAPPTLDDTP